MKVKLNKRDIPVAVEFFSNPIIYMRIQFFSILILYVILGLLPSVAFSSIC